MKVLRAPRTAEGIGMLIERIIREYKEHHMTISIYEDHVQILVYTGLDEAEIEYGEEIGCLRITAKGMILASVMPEYGGETLGIIILILQLISKIGRMKE